MARHQQGAQAQQQRIFFVDESGFSPLPSVVRTYAPVGHTPILQEWWTRDHLSAISATSPHGKLSFHSQDHAIDPADVVAFLEHLRRAVSGRMVIIWDGAPIHLRHLIRELRAHGAALRLHLERPPAYAPELNPGEGFWQQLKGVELHHVCCFNISPLRVELRDAVKRVRRKPHLIQSFFRGAKLELLMSGSAAPALKPKVTFCWLQSVTDFFDRNNRGILGVMAGEAISGSWQGRMFNFSVSPDTGRIA